MDSGDEELLLVMAGFWAAVADERAVMLDVAREALRRSPVRTLGQPDEDLPRAATATHAHRVRDCDLYDWRPVAPGVRKREYPGFDRYRGTPAALIAHGLCEEGQFPGQPGMRKVVVTIHADGSVAGGPPTRNDPDARRPGAKHVTRASKHLFDVDVMVTEPEWRKRLQRDRLMREQLERRRRALPGCAAQHESGRAHLRLVWSAS